jgi:catechol 2,3-dioxygenase-like lactoylglutathione lyase family enzyme
MTDGRLTTCAIRACNLEAMVAFYSEAFGARFRQVDTFGIPSRFGEIDGVTLKLVPIRDTTDFDSYPVHQLGFSVPDVDVVIAAALRHGGRVEGEIARDGGLVHAAIRDPDGNTIELYSAETVTAGRQ